MLAACGGHCLWATDRGPVAARRTFRAVRARSRRKGLGSWRFYWRLCVGRERVLVARYRSMICSARLVCVSPWVRAHQGPSLTRMAVVNALNQCIKTAGTRPATQRCLGRRATSNVFRVVFAAMGTRELVACVCVVSETCVALECPDWRRISLGLWKKV